MREAETENEVWWGEYNRPCTPSQFNNLLSRMQAFLQGEELWVQDCFVGAAPEYQMPIRIITDSAWQSMFARNMFITTNDQDRLRRHVPEFTVIGSPSFKADPRVDGTGSETAIVLNLAEPTPDWSQGTEVWRMDRDGNWTKVVSNGFGGDPGNMGTRSLFVYDGRLYASTARVGFEEGGGELWRTSDGENWERVVEGGFGDPDTVSLRGMVEFGGRLYLGGQNYVTGGKIWRSQDGTEWETIVDDGFGNPNNNPDEDTQTGWDVFLVGDADILDDGFIADPTVGEVGGWPENDAFTDNLTFFPTP